MDSKKITYKEIKAMQLKDMKAKAIDINIYRNFSTPFTWAFVKLGISPNTITISSFFICIIGFVFLSMGTYVSFVIGSFFFILFRTMDDIDGEVARATNKQSLEGLHFEGMQDYIYYCCLGVGLGIGLFRLYQSEIYLYLGFFLTFVFIARYAITDVLKSVLRKGVIDKRLSIISDKDLQKKLLSRINKGNSWADRNIFLRLFGIYPAGLAYSIEFIGPMLIVLTIIEYLLGTYINFPAVIYGQMIGILPVYLLIVGIIKLIEIISFISKLEKNRHITNFLSEF